MIILFRQFFRQGLRIDLQRVPDLLSSRVLSFVEAGGYGVRHRQRRLFFISKKCENDNHQTNKIHHRQWSGIGGHHNPTNRLRICPDQTEGRNGIGVRTAGLPCPDQRSDICQVVSDCHGKKAARKPTVKKPKPPKRTAKEILASMTDSERSALRRYRSSEAAWKDGDESAAMDLARYGL